MYKTRNFSRSRNAWADEQQALANVTEAQGIKPHLLMADHNETSFRWKTEIEIASGMHVFRLKRDKVADEAEAVKLAIEALHTFEGNLKTDHTNEEYVFVMIRA